MTARILVAGAGVIGSVYAARLLKAGEDVTLLARGQRLRDLREHGLVLEHASTGEIETFRPEVVESFDPGDRFDHVLVAVRHDQLRGVLPPLRRSDPAEVTFLCNAAGLVDELSRAFDGRAMFGFPAIGGARLGATIRYVQIAQQKTMLAEPTGESSLRLYQLGEIFERAGFPTHISRDPNAWLLAHAAFIVPIALALYRVQTNAPRLACDRPALDLMVRATRQAFRALRAEGNREIPVNLRALYLLLPTAGAAWYWARVLSGPRGELWFAAHARAAPEEVRDLTAVLLAHLEMTGRLVPALSELADRQR